MQLTAVGTLASSLDLTRGNYEFSQWGIAVSANSAFVAVTRNNYTVSVYSLPDGGLISSVAFRPATHGSFDWPAKCCFTPTNNVLFVEPGYKRVQEVTLAGEHVRFIGDGVITDTVWSIAATSTLIAVGKAYNTSNNRIMMFDAVTGVLVRQFGEHGDEPGQLAKYCNGLRFTQNNAHHIAVAESNGRGKFRVSVFTVDGAFVRCMGEGVLRNPTDVELAENGDVYVCDGFPGNQVCVFSLESGALLRQWSSTLRIPAGSTSRWAPQAAARYNGKLAVLDLWGPVQVFE